MCSWSNKLNLLCMGIRKLLEGNMQFIIIVLLLNIPGLTDDNFFDGMRHLLKLLFEVLIFCACIGRIPIKVARNIFKSIVIIISSVIFLLDVAVSSLYGVKFNIGMLEILAATNTREAREFIATYASVNICLEILGCILFILIISYILRKGYYHIININFVQKGLVVILLLSLGSGIVACFKHSDYMLYECSSIGRGYYMINTAYEDIKAYNEIQDKMAQNHITLTKNESELPLVIFILGESTNRNHMSIYGYNLPTTPNLEILQKNNQLHVFTDIISPHSHTVPVLQKLFTFYRTGASGKWYEYNNLFDILREAGYETVWISNQESSGVWGNVGQAYSEHCDKRKFIKIRTSKEYVESYDEDLLPELADELSLIGGVKFIAVHLMGTHGGYSQRYPKEWSYFDKNDEVLGINEGQKAVRASYDNAVLYNDYVVSEIIKKVQDKDAVVIYISDHAEEVYQDRDYAGHDEIKGTVHMIEVPMLIYTTTLFRKNHPVVERKIASAVNRPYMTDDMIHTILDMMDIEVVEYQSDRSVINDVFDVTRKRMYSGKLYIKDGLGSRLVLEE